MNDQDRDLILAVAAGDLGEAEAAAAMARISADPELAEELAAQRAAMDALGTVPPVAMTGTERAELRSGLMDQLSLDTAPAAAPAPKSARRWWQPVFGLAAAAAVVAAVVILPGTLGGDDAGDEVALTAETTAESPVTFSEDGAQEGGAESGESLDSAAADLTTTSAFAAPDADLTGASDELLAITKGRRSPQEVEESLDDAGITYIAPFTLDRTAAVEGCIEQLADELPAGDLLPLGTANEGGVEVVFVGVVGDGGIETVIAIDITTCSVLDSSG